MRKLFLRGKKISGLNENNQLNFKDENQNGTKDNKIIHNGYWTFCYPAYQ